MQMASARGRALLALLLCASLPAIAPAQVHAPTPVTGPESESFFYGAEWRLLRAGEVEVRWTNHNREVGMDLHSLGLVSKLLRVEDHYRTAFDPGFCALSLNLEAHEGKRNRETKVTFDRGRNRIHYLERDLNKNAVVKTNEMDMPSCVHDVLGAMQKLRELRPEPGTTLEFPVSDGKKLVRARVDAVDKEKISTPMGEFNTIRYEAFLFNGVLYQRKGRLFIWLSNDDKRLPVQLKIQLPFYIGTVTLQLEKAERK